MRVHIVDVCRRDASGFQRPLDAGVHAGAVWPWVCKVIGVAAHGAAHELRQNWRAARLRVLQGLQNEDTCAEVCSALQWMEVQQINGWKT